MSVDKTLSGRIRINHLAEHIIEHQANERASLEVRCSIEAYSSSIPSSTLVIID